MKHHNDFLRISIRGILWPLCHRTKAKSCLTWSAAAAGCVSVQLCNFCGEASLPPICNGHEFLVPVVVGDSYCPSIGQTTEHDANAGVGARVRHKLRKLVARTGGATLTLFTVSSVLVDGVYTTHAPATLHRSTDM